MLSATEDAAFLTRIEIFSGKHDVIFMVGDLYTHIHFILYPTLSYGCIDLGSLFLWMCPKATVAKALLQKMPFSHHRYKLFC